MGELYIVVTHQILPHFIERVENKILEGFSPVGGIAIRDTGNYQEYIQAMVLKVE